MGAPTCHPPGRGDGRCGDRHYSRPRVRVGLVLLQPMRVGAVFRLERLPDVRNGPPGRAGAAALSPVRSAHHLPVGLVPGVRRGVGCEAAVGAVPDGSRLASHCECRPVRNRRGRHQDSRGLVPSGGRSRQRSGRLLWHELGRLWRLLDRWLWYARRPRLRFCLDDLRRRQEPPRAPRDDPATSVAS